MKTPIVLFGAGVCGGVLLADLICGASTGACVSAGLSMCALLFFAAYIGERIAK